MDAKRCKPRVLFVNDHIIPISFYIVSFDHIEAVSSLNTKKKVGGGGGEDCKTALKL